jgi:hypothetical protein
MLKIKGRAGLLAPMDLKLKQAFIQEALPEIIKAGLFRWASGWGSSQLCGGDSR